MTGIILVDSLVGVAVGGLVEALLPNGDQRACEALHIWGHLLNPGLHPHADGQLRSGALHDGCIGRIRQCMNFVHLQPSCELSELTLKACVTGVKLDLPQMQGPSCLLSRLLTLTLFKLHLMLS